MQSLLLSTVASKSITSWRHLKAIGAIGIFAGMMMVEPMVIECPGEVSVYDE